MSRALPVALVLLCLTAGCSGLLDGGPDPGTDEVETVTPAPVERYPPGVSEATITNASALFAAHERLLANQSVTILANSTTWFANESVFTNGTRRLELAPNHVHQYGETTTHLGTDWATTGVVWANTTVGYTRVEYDGERQYASFRPREVEPVARLRPALPLVSDQLTAENVTVERVEQRLLRLTVEELVPRDEGYSNASLSMLVTDRGLVREYRYVVDHPCRPNRCRSVTTTRFVDVGSTRVERPDWVSFIGENVTVHTPG